MVAAALEGAGAQMACATLGSLQVPRWWQAQHLGAFRCPDGSGHNMWEPSSMRSQSQCYRTFALEVSKRHRTLAPESSQRHRLVRRRRAWELVVLEKVLNRHLHVSVQVSMM